MLLAIQIFFLTLVKIVHCAEITLNPVSRNVTLNSTVEFTCQGIGDVITFNVDGEFASTPNIVSRGFQLLSESTVNGTVTRSLMATAYEENNNTNITCVILPSSPIVTSPPAVLMIQGILDGVGDLMATVMDGSSVSLTWTPPYSLDNVPITGYNIITSDGINITVNTPYHILTSSDPDPCNITTVSVGAINDVGTSQYNNVSFYYYSSGNNNSSLQVDDAIQINPTINNSLTTLRIDVNAIHLCIEFPVVIVINIINTDNVRIQEIVTRNYSHQQLQLTELLNVNVGWTTFIVNVSLSNMAVKISHFVKFGFIGSVNSINSSVINCSTINVSWEKPSVFDGVNIHNYTLLIYDDVSHTLVDRVSVNGSVTSYQFEDDDLFHHRYTYVIYGNNELGQGNYSNRTFSYQRVPDSVVDNTIFDVSPTCNNFLHFHIPFLFECTNEALKNISIEITCDSTMIYSQTYPVEYANHPVNITGNISLELTKYYQRCSLSIVFSNSAGHSEPFIVNDQENQCPPPPSDLSSSSQPNSSVYTTLVTVSTDKTSPSDINILLYTIIPSIFVTMTIVLISCVIIIAVYTVMRKKSGTNRSNEVATLQVNEAYADITQLNISLPTIKFNPAYEEIDINYERVY